MKEKDKKFLEAISHKHPAIFYIPIFMDIYPREDWGLLLAHVDENIRLTAKAAIEYEELMKKGFVYERNR